MTVPDTHGNPDRARDGGREIVRRLRAGGFVAYWAGGCVRDGLLGLPVKDVDIATTARPEQVSVLFPDARLVGASFGVVVVPLDGLHFEVATFRRDGEYIDHRRPESVEFGTPEQDARRRDFTINGIFQDPDTGEIIDFVGGRADLDARVVRAIGDPRARFAEDALRLLRAIRFAARLDFEIEPATWRAIRELAPTIDHISAERIRDEMTAILTSARRPSRAFRMLDAAGLLARILPEIVAMHGVEQGPDVHPEGDVWEHTMLCLDNVEPRTPVVCWAMLLHDVGKPVTFARTPERRISFFAHDARGAEIAAEICARLRFPNDDTRRIAAIVGRHMRFLNAHEWNAATMRRFLAAETIEEDLAIHRSDCLSSNGWLNNWELVRGKLRELRERAEPALPPPLLTGDDLVAMGLRPGPEFKRLLARVQEAQLNGEIQDPDAARELVREMLAGSGDV